MFDAWPLLQLGTEFFPKRCILTNKAVGTILQPQSEKELIRVRIMIKQYANEERKEQTFHH